MGTTDADLDKKRKVDCITPEEEATTNDTPNDNDAAVEILVGDTAVGEEKGGGSTQKNGGPTNPDDDVIMQVDEADTNKALDDDETEGRKHETIPGLPEAQSTENGGDAAAVIKKAPLLDDNAADTTPNDKEETLEEPPENFETKQDITKPTSDPASVTPTAANNMASDHPINSIKNKSQKGEGLVNQYSDPSYANIRYVIIENDGSPAALIKLVGLKSLFAKQLPKMPRAYIARLVFDRRHVSLAILSSDLSVRDTDEEIIGAICYRPFHEQRFAEIAFCAVNGNHQVKGYGTKLMILLKQHAARDGIEYFITYADNFAIGYFKKQGFTKSITMPKGRYHGLIKDYDGGTPMECYIHPSIDFTRIEEMVEAQRKFILDRIALTAKSATAVYLPIRKLQIDETPLSRSNPSIAKALSIPGVTEAGWTVADLLPDAATGRDGSISAAALKTEILEAIRKISEQQYAWPFREPVNVEEVPDYLDIIKNPIDLKTMERKAKQDTYKNKQMLFNDVMLMCDNCRVFNEDGSQYTQCANKVERYTRNLLADCIRKTSKK